MSDRGDRYEATAHRRAFGERVRQLRQARGWTQERLAEAADIDRSYIAGIETGAKRVSIDLVYRLASGLGVQAAELFEGT